jgi:hypothetical protein
MNLAESFVLRRNKCVKSNHKSRTLPMWLRDIASQLHNGTIVLLDPSVATRSGVRLLFTDGSCAWLRDDLTRLDTIDAECYERIPCDAVPSVPVGSGATMADRFESASRNEWRHVYQWILPCLAVRVDSIEAVFSDGSRLSRVTLGALRDEGAPVERPVTRVTPVAHAAPKPKRNKRPRVPSVEPATRVPIVPCDPIDTPYFAGTSAPIDSPYY